jgi:hypothetical protein
MYLIVYRNMKYIMCTHQIEKQASNHQIAIGSSQALIINHVY